MANQISVMIIDDDPDLRIVLKNYLIENYNVVQAENGLDALEKMDKEVPDIIIVDAMMPKMNGFLFLEVIKTMERFKYIPTIMLTGLDESADLKEGYRKGASLYLFKPVDRERLLEVLENEIKFRSLKEEEEASE